MFRELIGDIGHLFVITSFISAIIAAFSYGKLASQSGKGLVLENSPNFTSWKTFSRTFFYIHVFAVLGIVLSLFLIIYNHFYEYHYAWSHSSNSLPIYYMISSFWEGQEGSFLLWMFWHAMLGMILIRVNKTWEFPVMAVFCAVQAFLASMIIGAAIPWLELKIGSSPFILLKDFMGDIPVYKSNPGYIPEDGTGLNPLLQNYWMVIHPPTLFLGFAATLVPFAYCIGGLWTKRYKEWIRPALPWALFAALILGTGILMGAYWAYETLNFGGYWNWDPVENAVYVPWLILVAAIHAMIIFRNSDTALKASTFLVIATFILILYSTFLTRSGILGESSVHSFTDLGLSGQLLIYLLFFLFASIALIVIRWKELPSTEKESSTYSREFWIFIGITVISLMAFQVLYATSIPVYNSILRLFGIESKIAPPVDQEIYYSNWQIWFAIGIAILSGLGQFFWWKKIDKKKLKDAIAIPLIISLLSSSLIIYFADLNKVSYILLVWAALFSVLANISILWGIIFNNYKIAGGAIAHIGVGLMFIGILFSSGYSKVVSVNSSGLVYSKEFSDEMNRDNVLLWRNEPMQMNDFEMLYKGQKYEAKGFPGYIAKEDLFLTEKEGEAVAKKDIIYKDKIYFKKGAPVHIFAENLYYEIDYKKASGDVFTLFPRAQVNPQMGLLASPDIKRYWGKDLYTHVSSIPVSDDQKSWSATEDFKVQIKDTLFWNDYVTVFEGVDLEQTVPGVSLGDNEFGVKAKLRVFTKNGPVLVQPLFIVKKDMIGQVPEIVDELGLKITFINVNTESGEFHFQVNSAQKDYIILKAIEKPLINVLWIGTLLVITGLLIAIIRRYTEFAKMRDKGME
jgi:cytochrome c-type biogenesis protein CcmF